MPPERASDKGGGLSDYLLPQRICATCGQPTSGGRNPGSAGAWHYDCRRDPQGHLIVKPTTEGKAA